MKLSECTKADLLWIIKRIQQGYLHDGDFAIQRALGDLALEKAKQLNDEADRLANLADEKRREYINVLSGYDGMRIIDIPLPVLEQADKLMKEAQELDQKWIKLLGLKPQEGT